MKNLFAEAVYRNYANNITNFNPGFLGSISRYYGRHCGYIRQCILRLRDPQVRMKVGTRLLSMDLSNETPLFMKEHEYYNTAIVRLAGFLNTRHGYLTMIDVGANIGDTVSLISESVAGRFLCIEADKKYFRHLLLNTKNIDNVHCVKALCDQSDGAGDISFARGGGSSHVSQDPAGESSFLQKVTLDSLIENQALFKNTNFIKIDTDGYDYRVIRGCDRLIANNHPVLFFELDPRFLRAAGEDPASIFEYLLQRGYKSVLLYDNLGFPVMKISIDEMRYIRQLLEYAGRKKTYFDVLVFHDSNIADFELFFENEMKFFDQKLK